MKIAVVTSLFPSAPRPFEGIFAERRWTRMAARGHEVRVVHPQPFTPPGVGFLLPLAWGQVARMPRHEQRGPLSVVRPRYLHVPGRALGNARRFAGRALAHLPECEVVVCDYAWPASALAPSLRRAGVACVVSGRGSDVLEVAGEAGLGEHLKQNLRAAGSWCAVSQDLVRTMDELAGEARGQLVPNGVDLETFRPRDRAEARAKLHLARETPLVLVVGHLIPRKDPLLALAAFLAGAPLDAQLVFVGSGPLEDGLRAEIAERGVGHRVRLAGEQQPGQLAEWLAAADLLLLTSTREGRPNVVLEALASGRPVLATAAGGTAELLPDERMLATSRAPLDIARQLARLLADPPAAQELRASVEALSWENSSLALERCLEAALHTGEVAA